MHHDKPAPLYLDFAVRRRCPVCGAIAYSREGIHPQCAMAQADAPRAERLKKRALMHKHRVQKERLRACRSAVLRAQS